METGSTVVEETRNEVETENTVTEVEIEDTNDVDDEDTNDEDVIQDELSEAAARFEEQMADAPVIEDVGSIEAGKSIDTLNKSGYYVVFADQTHERNSIDKAIKSVHIARFETRTQMKQVIKSIQEKGLKVIDIIKGRPLSFEIKVKTVSEVVVGK